MSPQTIDSIVTIILAVLGALGGGLVSARLTKTGVELNYKQMFEDAATRILKLTDTTEKLEENLRIQVEQTTEITRVSAEREKQTTVAIAALTAKFELVENQRIEQEKRHALEMNGLNARIAELNVKIVVLETENAGVKTELQAAMSKLAKTEHWVDLLQTRLNPPPLSAADSQAIQTLRDKPPASEPSSDITE